jgi:hypothetical protein
VHQVLAEAIQNGRLQHVAPDCQPVPGGSAVPGVRASVVAAAREDEPAAACAAGDEAGEQVARRRARSERTSRFSRRWSESPFPQRSTRCQRDLLDDPKIGHVLVTQASGGFGHA